ncbi:hypothetical protein KSP39_PZI004575 [Platanthera zijinensis]|uniref:Uncharacterized protein n=1 Tax=Platanthera zijinensis TaxID=2320716 RepID=A0AAP0BZ13_9ASPA
MSQRGRIPPEAAAAARGVHYLRRHAPFDLYKSEYKKPRNSKRLFPFLPKISSSLLLPSHMKSIPGINSLTKLKKTKTRNGVEKKGLGFRETRAVGLIPVDSFLR